MKVNKIYNENCLGTMAKMPDGFVDLTVTSPPYDNLRTYTGETPWNEDVWKSVIKELFRVTKKGGVVVWIVGDAVVKGSETGTSFKQALWAMECGFNLHDTMIWVNKKPMPRDTRIPRYWQSFEYVFIFSNGKPSLNMIREPSKHAGAPSIGGTRKPDGSIRKDRTKKLREQKAIVNPTKPRANVWYYTITNTTEHPAPFSEQLAHDHIISWSNEGDLTYDPFMGSGTTAKMAILNNRSYIGSEISKEYCEIAEKRLRTYLQLQH